MTDETAFLNGHAPPPERPFDNSRKVECRALVNVGGRPRLGLTRELAEKICDLVAGGKTIRKIGDMEGMPSRATIRRWIAEDEDFRRAYAMAKEGLHEDLLEEILEIADDGSKDFDLDEGADGMPVVKPVREAIARSALRIETRFRVLAKMAPSKYGDAAQLAAPEQAALPPGNNGDGAKVIDGEVIPIERHPLFDSVQAWGKVAKEAK